MWLKKWMGDVVRENSTVRLVGTQNKEGRDGSRLGIAAGVGTLLGGGKEGASAAASPKTFQARSCFVGSSNVSRLQKVLPQLTARNRSFVTRREPVTQPFATSCSTPAAAGYRLSLTCPPILPLMMCKLQQRDGTKGLPPKCAPAFSLLYVPSELASVVLASDTLRLQMSLSTLDSSS